LSFPKAATAERRVRVHEPVDDGSVRQRLYTASANSGRSRVKTGPSIPAAQNPTANLVGSGHDPDGGLLAISFTKAGSRQPEIPFGQIYDAVRGLVVQPRQ
jgi:hypothetical protein